MKKIALIIILFCNVMMAHAIMWYSVNFDTQTVAMMTGAYATEFGIESYYREQTDKILEHYEAAGVASAGIFASKYLDRKALTDLGGWSSSTENYYYKRIYNMVSRKIIPKMWDCATIMLRDPSTAIHWGSYLLKTCDEVKSLCNQFESVVTNGSLNFNDIAFIEINSNLKNILKLSELGGVNWKDTFESLGDGSSMSSEDLNSDVSTLYNMGVGLATSGWQGAAQNLLSSSSFNSTAMQKASAITNLASQFKSIYDSSNGNIGQMVESIVGGDVNNLFTSSSYTNSSWQSDYSGYADKRYYKQRYYLYSVDQGSITLCDYNPDESNDHVMNGSDWYHISTTDKSYYPNSSERDAILSNSENYCGYSRSWVNNANAQNDGYTYNITTWMHSYYVWRGSEDNVIYKSFAYSIKVTKDWYHKMVAYEDTFDSYNMDLSTFKKQMQVKLQDLNRNEDGITYYMGYDSKKYYTKSDAAKLKGAETATISVACNSGASLGEGSTQYKCGDCGSNVYEHALECSMYTSLQDTGLDTSELDNNINSLSSEITTLSTQISNLENQQSDIVSRLRLASGDEYINLRKQYNDLSAEINNLKSQKEDKENLKKQYEDAKAEAQASEAVQTDDWYRIPAIMNDMKNAYRMTWNDDGHWDGSTYVRTAKISGINGVITFRADVTIARKPKYFLFIKIHRAIVGIHWKLTTEYGDKEVVEVVNLDPDKSDQEKANEVNARISAVQADYPDCEVSVEYNKAEGGQDDDTQDVQHLLWNSDRLEIAREIDTRLNKIYASLVCYEKMMHYKYSFIDFIKDQLPNQNDDAGRRYSLVQKCLRRWLHNAASNSGQDYDGRYDDEEE